MFVRLSFQTAQTEGMATPGAVADDPLRYSLQYHEFIAVVGAGDVVQVGVDQPRSISAPNDRPPNQVLHGAGWGRSSVRFCIRWRWL